MLCCLLLSAAVVWTDPPEFVYRADLRDPMDVFEKGFPALGNDDDLHNHVTGASCGTARQKGTTIFVDTCSEHLAIKWGEVLISKSDFDGFYIYQIRTTASFHHCENSLRDIAKKIREGKDDPKKYQQYLYDADKLEEKKRTSRWLAHSGVPKELIVRVDYYNKKSRGYLTKEWTLLKSIAADIIPQGRIPYKQREPIITACWPSQWYVTGGPPPVLPRDQPPPIPPRDPRLPPILLEQRAKQVLVPQGQRGGPQEASNHNVK